MKKNIIFLLLMIAIVLCLGYMTWRQMLWKNEAMITANFAAELLAGNYYDKGKLIKLELVVKDKPEGYQDKPYRFDGPYVVFDWIGYTDPLCRFSKSPSILVAQEFVKTYNAEMNEIVSDPNKYERRIHKEINYWQENVLRERSEGLKSNRK